MVVLLHILLADIQVVPSVNMLEATTMTISRNFTVKDEHWILCRPSN